MAVSTRQYAGAAVALAGAGLAVGLMRSRRLRIGARRADTRAALGGRGGIIVHESETINRPASELYRFWRTLENLPRTMSYLESVTDLGGGRSHWVARARGIGRVEWDAEIINDQPGKLVAWRSLPGSDVTSAGSVNFDETEDGGTRVTVRLQYDPPAGKLGALVAKILGDDPARQIRDDLRKLKQQLEVPTKGVLSSP
jgi:uncharacterized membrane protein